jgi:serine/threonine-protein kinase
VQRVAADGGDPATLTTVDTAKGEIGHIQPFMMPGGRHVLFSIVYGTRSQDAQIASLDLKTGRIRTILRGGTAPVYVESGHLVYSGDGTIRAVRFDARQLQVVGDPIPVIDQVMSTPNGIASFAVARTGTLVYVPAGTSSGTTPPRSLVWVDRFGHETAINAPARSYATGRLSPDGTRVALDVREDASDIWVYDLARESLTPLNVDSALDVAPIWTQDSKKIVWSSVRRGGVPNLFVQSADGTGAPQQLATSGTAQFPTSTSPDRSLVLFFSPNALTGTNPSLDLFTLTLTSGLVAPLLQSPFRKAAAEISPDGRWLAYQSDESGRNEIYVRPFPDVNAARWPISTAGGTRPAWTREGRELFYLDGDGYLTSASVVASQTNFAAAKPRKILNSRYVAGSSTRGWDLRGYDVSADSRRFLMIKEAAVVHTPPRPDTMVVVLNWHEELKKRAPP